MIRIKTIGLRIILILIFFIVIIFILVMMSHNFFILLLRELLFIRLLPPYNYYAMCPSSLKRHFLSDRSIYIKLKSINYVYTSRGVSPLFRSWSDIYWNHMEIIYGQRGLRWWRHTRTKHCLWVPPVGWRSHAWGKTVIMIHDI